MLLGKTLVALRKSDDVERIASFLNRINERPHLLFAMLDFRDIADSRVMSFDHSNPDDFLGNLNGYEFEVSRIPYRADKMPARVFLEEAIKRRCDNIIVVSAGTDALFHADLASTLAAESSIPVLVIHG